MRCTKRGIDCIYEQTAAARNVLARTPAVVDAKTAEKQKQQRPSPAYRSWHVDDEFLPSGDFAFLDDLAMGDARNGAQGHDMGQPTYVATQTSSTIEPLTFDELFAFGDDISPQHQCWADLSLAPQTNLDLKSPHWCAWMRGNVSLAVVSDTSPTLLTSNSLSMPHRSFSQAQHNADIIIQSLRSFPTMMIRKETLPWFIHPHLSAPGENGLSEALSNCMSIAQMFSSRTSETKSFLCRTMAAEHRRIQSEVRAWLETCSVKADYEADVSYVQV